MKFSALVPVYNEVDSLPKVLAKIIPLPEIHEIVVVDDCSTDGTREFLQSFRHDKVTVLFHKHNQGKTGAINTAINAAHGDFVIIQDADLEYDPEEIPMVLEPIIKGYADVVYGSRFLVRKASRVLYFYHFIANKFLTYLSNAFTNMNMTDIETCYKAFPIGLVKGLGLKSKGFGMEVEITALLGRSKPRVYEVPISYYGRTYQEGKKIQTIDGLYAIFYIIYFNLIYVRQSRVIAHLKAFKR